MHLLTPFLLLAWCPWSVLGDIAVAVQTNGGVLKPGQVLNYVVSANPLPSGTLGMVLIGVSAPGQTGGRVFWPWSIVLNTSPKQGAITIPSGVPPKFYTVDVHANTSVYSPLLASSNAFEIVANTPPTTQDPPTTIIPPTTRQTTIVTTQLTVIQPNSPQPQPDPTSQNPVVTNKPVTTQNPPSNAPSSNNPANTNSGSTTGQSSPTSPGQTASQTAGASTTDPAPTPSADTSVDIPPTTSEKKKSSPIGPAVGGAIGGIIIILLLFFLWRRYNKKKHDRLAIDDMAESNSRYRDADGAVATSAASPFANTFREFQPNRGNTAVSPFLLDSERTPPPTSPEPTMSSKYREAYGGGAGRSGQTHHQNTSFGASTGYLESTSGTGGTSEQLRTERERVLGEISALRSRGGQGGSAYAQSSVSAGSSGAREGGDEEMRNRLDMLTQHVARLENALEQAVNVNVYEAPPTYHQAPSQAAASQRG